MEVFLASQEDFIYKLTSATNDLIFMSTTFFAQLLYTDLNVELY